MSTVTIELQPLGGPRERTLARRPAQPRAQHETFARRRAAVLLTLICGLTVAGLMVRTGPGPSGGDPASASGRVPAASSAPAIAPGVAPPASGHPTHLVQPGDTLWSIAQGLVGGGDDVARLVDQIDDLNGGDALQVGQLLLLPG